MPGAYDVDTRLATSPADEFSVVRKWFLPNGKPTRHAQGHGVRWTSPLAQIRTCTQSHTRNIRRGHVRRARTIARRRSCRARAPDDPHLAAAGGEPR
jgi:hypothetical protein